MTSFRDAFKRRAGAAGMRVAQESEPTKQGAPVITSTGIPKPPKRK